MSKEVVDRTVEWDRAEKAADLWIGKWTWLQQAGIEDLNAKFRSMWMHGYVTGLADAQQGKPPKA